MMQSKNSKGFTLIEIMVVIVIIGVLAALAIPAYTDYLVRSRVSELLNVGSTAQTAIAEYRLTNNAMPSSIAQVGITSISSQYVSSVDVGANGVITITGNQTTLGSGGALAITLTPTYSNGAISWTCSSTGATQYVPGSCR